ncbi:hypothetical protein HY464_02015 [Candidatus Peregrinibacteria bacterium]|nr:hypothetical protein [Candidatus Peregrinibacteria bacterium]
MMASDRVEQLFEKHSIPDEDHQNLLNFLWTGVANKKLTAKLDNDERYKKWTEEAFSVVFEHLQHAMDAIGSRRKE